MQDERAEAAGVGLVGGRAAPHDAAGGAVVIVDWDHDARCGYEAARRRRLSIPDDLSVVSISTERNMICTRIHPQLTNLHLNGMEIGRLTVLAMLDRFTGKKIATKDMLLPYRLDVRGS